MSWNPTEPGTLDDESWLTKPDDYAPGTMGCHEALHVTALIEHLIDVELVKHAAISMNPEWMALALTAQESLQRLYQLIGAKHLA
jgi:hypothetical protein